MARIADFQMRDARRKKRIWTIVKGKGQLLLNDTIKEVNAGESIIINKEDKYSIKAIEELHIIEVQIGDELIEEDIERFEWDWNK